MTRLDRLDFDMVLRTQQHLYRRALTRPDGERLSARALAYDADEDTGFGCDPAFPVYPASVGARVHDLPPDEHARLTRILFAAEKQNVAQNEMITLTWNTRCASRAFGTFSDAYWVQHRETLDEYDHIYGFQVLAEKVLGGGLSPDELAAKNRFREYTFHALDPVLRSPQAVPALYFTLRFVANTFLKMVEGFCFDPRRTDVTYSPALAAINQAHHDDEARHFTSSWAFGRHLFARIEDAREQELVRALIVLYLGLHVRSLALGGHHVRTGFEAISLAIDAGAVPSLGLTKDEVAEAYRQHTTFVDLAPSRRREAFRWGASQLRKLEVALGVTSPEDYAPTGLHPENAATIEAIHQAILENGAGPDDLLPLGPCYEAYRAMLAA